MIIEKARPHHSRLLQRELQELMSNVFQHVRRKITSDRIRQNLVVLFFICPNMALSSLSTTEPFDIDSPACYTLLNGTGTIGCRSLRQHGEAHPVSIIETAADLDFFSKSDSQEKRIILLSKELFTRENLLLLEQSSKCGGVLLEWSANIPDEYSPDVKYQYCSCDDSTDCDHAWNSAGDGVAAEDFDFPILALTPGASTEVRSSAQQSSLLENSIRSHPQYVLDLCCELWSQELLQNERWLYVHLPGKQQPHVARARVCTTSITDGLLVHRAADLPAHRRLQCMGANSSRDAASSNTADRHGRGRR